MFDSKAQEEIDFVETIMRALNFGDYDKYNSKEERVKWAKFVEGDDKDEALVREQPGRGESNS